MKSLAELQAIKERTLKAMSARNDSEDATRIVVGMATCGIAAGARPVLNAFVEEVTAAGLTDKVTVTQTGCIGICQYEPVVEVFVPGEEKVTYVKMVAARAKEVIEYYESVLKIVEDHTATLTDEQKKHLVEKLKETTKYESFEMNYQVDEALIGGMVIRIGDRVVDSSIKTKLYNLSRELRNIQV